MVFVHFEGSSSGDRKIRSHKPHKAPVSVMHLHSYYAAVA